MSKAGDTLCPAPTVTETGTLATDGSLLASCTTAPPVGAAPDNPTLLLVAMTPPGTDAPPRFSVDNTAGVTVSTACLLTPLYVAVIVTDVELATAVVAIVNTGDMVDPAATTTDAGTDAAGLLLDRLTNAPPAGAAAVNVTRFDAVVEPPITVAGDNVSELTAGGATVTTASLLPPL
jgi:hypothetical protein